MSSVVAWLAAFLGSSGDLTNEGFDLAIVRVWTGINGIGQFLQDILGSERGAWLFAKPQIIGGAWGLGQLAYNERQAWERLLGVIIPNSLKWLDGHTHQWVDPALGRLWHELTKFENFQYGWDTATANWANHWVDPNLSHWIQWFDDWHTRVETVSQTWWDWLHHPDQFGNWGAPPLIGPTIAYYSAPEHKESRDNLTQIIVDATADMPLHVESAILAWLNADVSNGSR